MTESLTLMAGTSSVAGFVHLVKAVNAGGGFFGNAAPVLHDIVPAGLSSAWIFFRRSLMTCSSLLPDGVLTQSLPFSSS